MSKKENGLSLLDIAPMRELVQIGDQHVAVHGLTVENMVRLFRRFPEVQSWMTGSGEVKATQMVTVAPDALAAAIALATFDRHGGPESEIEEAETAARGLGVEYQIEIVEAIGRLTFRKGFAPFVLRVTNLMNGIVDGSSSKVPATISPRASKPSSSQDSPTT